MKEEFSWRDYDRYNEWLHNVLETQQEEIERLNKELDYYKKEEELYRYYQQEVPRLNNIIKIMEKYFELIVDLGYDYDGLNNEESLKKLIDELCRYASLGRAYNTTEVIYVNGDKKYNILNEEILDKGE